MHILALVSLALAEVCPPSAPSDVDGEPLPSPAAAPGSGTRLSDGGRAATSNDAGDQHIDYVAFTSESGSVSKMAIVRRRLPRVIGRYLLGEPIAAGGMATVHLGRLLGPAGFSRTVAVKRLHAHLAANQDLVQSFVDEARVASRVRHANVVQTLDVVAVDDELLLVLDYVHGESFARLRRLASAAGTAIPPRVAAGIIIGVLRGLHAAHEAKSAKGAPLDLVHADVSPQNILVGADGVARVLDFGIAKAAGARDALTNPRRDIKGKLAYMPPEQVSGQPLDRRADLFAVGVVLWEALAGERLFRCEDELSTMDAIYTREPPRLAERSVGVSSAVDDVLARALAKDASDRFETADAMGRALEAALAPAGNREIAEWVEQIAGELLIARAERVSAFEGDDTGSSKARLFASDQSVDETTARRNALVPPPLESVTNETSTTSGSRMRGPMGTLPTLEREASVARAATSNLSGSVALDVSELRPVNTPMVMVAQLGTFGAESGRESGQTRIGPVERRVRPRTPIPMPMGAKKRRAPSLMQLALLVIVPPLLVVAGLTAVRPLRATAAGSAPIARLNALVATPVAMPLPPTAVEAPAPPASAAPPVASAVAVAGAAVVEGAAPIAPAKAGTRGDRKGGRGPTHRPARPGPRVAVPVNR